MKSLSFLSGFDCMKAIKNATATAPIKCYDVIIENICDVELSRFLNHTGKTLGLGRCLLWEQHCESESGN